MNGALDIRPCNVNDIEVLSALAIKAYKEVYLYLWNDDGSWYINRVFSNEQFQKEFEDSNAEFFMVLFNESPIGFMKLNIDLPLPGFEYFDAMELERIYLLKSASGMGFGRKAVEFCFKYAQSKHKEMIWLKSMDSSDALYFYSRMGFKEVGEYRLDYEIMKPEFRGMKILMKRLT